jgi:DNA-binding response OmpR family regulator
LNSIALFGFANPESLRLVTSLSVLDPSLRFINFTSETNKDQLDSGVQCALIWAAGAGLSGLSGLVNTAADAGLPVVVIMPLLSLDGITTSRAQTEVCFQPCTPEEVSLRLRLAILRNAPRETSNTITRGDLVIDCDRYEVTLKGLKVDLTYKEYELLKYLASNPGRVFTRESLLRSVWEYDYFGGTRTVDVHVRRLRSKINDVSNHFIETQWNVGYRFRATDKSPEPSQENSSKFNSTI